MIFWLIMHDFDTACSSQPQVSKLARQMKPMYLSVRTQITSWDASNGISLPTALSSDEPVILGWWKPESSFMTTMMNDANHPLSNSTQVLLMIISAFRIA